MRKRQYRQANQESLIPLPEWTLINATRYAIGRMTYITSETADLICHIWPRLSDDTKGIIRQDLEEAFRWNERWKKNNPDVAFSSPLGMECDKRSWERVRALWGQEQAKE